MTPRIGVDARLLAGRARRGVAQYEHNMLTSLLSLDPGVQFVLLSDVGIARDLVPDERLEVRVYPVNRGWRFNLWLQAILPYAARRERLDLLWCPANEPPYVQPVPCVVTVHDVKILARQETLLGRHYSYGGRLMPAALLKARRILADSEFTKSEIRRLVHCPPDHIQVAHLGVSGAYRPPTDSASETLNLSRKYNVPERFCLALGASAPYKNTGALIRVFSRLFAAGAIRTHLVVVGNQSDTVDQFAAIAKQEGGADGIHFLGYVPSEDLVSFLGCARFFVYPSLYEGFGFPPLEAMACGTPVLAANSSSIPEVAGAGAMLFDGESPDSLRSGILEIEALCEDAERRVSVSRFGMSHAATFTWDRTARATLDVLLKALGGR